VNERKVIVAGWFLVDPEKRDEVVESYNGLVLRARSARGCLDLAISADPVDPSRINNFEIWQSEEDLDSWRAVANPPKRITPILGGEMEKHGIHRSGPPFRTLLDWAAVVTVDYELSGDTPSNRRWPHPIRSA